MSVIRVPQVPDRRGERSHRLTHCGPDSSKMLCPAHSLPDVVCFLSNVKTMFKLSKLSNLLSLDIFLTQQKNSYTIPMPSGIQKHLTFNPNSQLLFIKLFNTLRSLMNSFSYSGIEQLWDLWVSVNSTEPSIVLQVQKLITAIRLGREVSDQFTVPGAELSYHTWITRI